MLYEVITYTGTVAAACGGTTTIVDHPAFGPKGCSLDYQINKYHGLAKDKAVIDVITSYSIHYTKLYDEAM